MEAEPCSGSSSVVDKKRKKKRKPRNRNCSDLRMDKEDNFPDKNSLVNVTIALPPPFGSSSALEKSTAQPCNELNPLPKKRKVQETSTNLGDTGAEVPYSVLQANGPDVKDNITYSSGNYRQSLEHEKMSPTGPTERQKRKKEKIKLRRKQKKQAKAKAKVSGKSNMLKDIPNNISQVAGLDESIIKEFSSACGKQSDVKKNVYLLEKEDVHGEAHTKETSFHPDEACISHLSDTKPDQVEERIQATSARAPMGIFDFFLSLSRI